MRSSQAGYVRSVKLLTGVRVRHAWLRRVQRGVGARSVFSLLAIVVLAKGSPAPHSPAASSTGSLSSASQDLATDLGVSFPADSQSQLILQRGEKRYVIDVARREIRELGPSAKVASAPATATAAGGSALQDFSRNCAVCHGKEAQGIPSVGTPDFHNPEFQRRVTDQELSAAIHKGKGGRMPAWSGKLSDPQISDLVTYLRALSPDSRQTNLPTTESKKQPGIYKAGDDLVFSLPTGRPTDKHGLYVNFAHRFAFDPAFTGTGRGEILFGLDGFAIPSFGFRFGVTDNFFVGIYRSPSIIARPIQLMAGYTLLDENKGAPLNLTARVSIEGQNNFRKSYTENIETILSRSITGRSQVYLVPTISWNDRALAQGGFRSKDIPDLPGINAFSLGVGAAFDVRPTVALVAELIPTLVNGRALGIHRPAYSFGIQKKIWRHAFTLGVTTSPGTTISQRAGTRAEFLGDPSADTPGGLFLGFDLTRQIK